MSAGGDNGGQNRRQRIDGKWASPDRKWTKESDEKANVDGHGHAAKGLHSSLALVVEQVCVWTREDRQGLCSIDVEGQCSRTDG